MFSLQAHMLTKKHTIHRKKGLCFKSPKQKRIQFHIDTIVFCTFSCLSTQSLTVYFRDGLLSQDVTIVKRNQALLQKNSNYNDTFNK